MTTRPTTTNRRAVLAALPAIGLAPAAAPAGPPPPGDTPILRLFSEWLRMFVETELCDFTDDEVAARSDQQWRIAEEMMDLPPLCACDVAAKVAAGTGLGEYELDEPLPRSRIWQDVLSVCGAAA